MQNSLVVTGGEDRYLNVWQCSEQQIILQPAQSIWSVAILPNTDIVVGSRQVFYCVFCYAYSFFKYFIVIYYFGLHGVIVRIWIVFSINLLYFITY